jgi:DNA-directed RNA polymerase specialized sigma24 family protein
MTTLFESLFGQFQTLKESLKEVEEIASQNVTEVTESPTVQEQTMNVKTTKALSKLEQAKMPQRRIIAQYSSMGFKPNEIASRLGIEVQDVYNAKQYVKYHMPELLTPLAYDNMNTSEKHVYTRMNNFLGKTKQVVTTEQETITKEPISNEKYLGTFDVFLSSDNTVVFKTPNQKFKL